MGNCAAFTVFSVGATPHENSRGIQNAGVFLDAAVNEGQGLSRSSAGGSTLRCCALHNAVTGSETPPAQATLLA
jgi:hypothetical protein